MPASSFQQQKLRVCEVCSAYLGLHDNDRRLADHFGGKLHLGFIEIREKLEKLRVSIGGKLHYNLYTIDVPTHLSTYPLFHLYNSNMILTHLSRYLIGQRNILKIYCHRKINVLSLATSVGVGLRKKLLIPGDPSTSYW